MEKPWENEPNFHEWNSETGLPCIVKRNYSGCLCGYVGVRPDHPAFNQGYDIVPVEVHGGLTYGACRRPTSSDSSWPTDERYWLGFDCDHAYDHAPSRQAFSTRDPESEYRDFAYVTAETESLAQQLSEME
jgi:hypothetical protein